MKCFRTDNTYNEYIEHQLKKTTDPKIIKRFADRREQRVINFCSEFKVLVKHVSLKTKRILCLGARYGEEVEALQKFGYNAIGIDLVPYAPWVVEGDFHKIPFEENTFSVLYSNSIDHIRDFPLFASEVCRVLTNDGWLLVKISMKDMGTYETLQLDSGEEFIQAFPSFKVVHRHISARDSILLHRCSKG